MSNLSSHGGPSNQQDDADFAGVLHDLQTTQADVVPMDLDFEKAMEEMDAIIPDIGDVDMSMPIMDLPADSPIVQAMMNLGSPLDDVDSMLIADLANPLHDTAFRQNDNPATEQQNGMPTIQDRLEENVPQSISTLQVPGFGMKCGVTKRPRMNSGSDLGLETGNAPKHARTSDRNEPVAPMPTSMQSENTPSLWSEIESYLDKATPIDPPSNQENLGDAENNIPGPVRGTLGSAPDTGSNTHTANLPRQYTWVPVSFPGEFHPAPIEHEEPSGYLTPYDTSYSAPVPAIGQSDSHNSRFPSGRVSISSHTAYLPVASVIRGASISDNAQGGVLNSSKVLACEECRINHRRCKHKAAVAATRKPPHQVCEECRGLKRRCTHRRDVESLLPLTSSPLGSGISVPDSDGTPTTAPLDTPTTAPLDTPTTAPLGTPQTAQTPTMPNPLGNRRTRNPVNDRCQVCIDTNSTQRCLHLNSVAAACAKMSNDLLTQHTLLLRTQIRELETTREELVRIIKDNKKAGHDDLGDTARRRRNIRIRIRALSLKYQTACAELEKRGLELPD